MRAATAAQRTPDAALLVEQMWTAITEGYVVVADRRDPQGLRRWLADAATALSERDKTEERRRMFKVTSNPTFTRVVKVRVPCDGGYSDESLKATYRVLPTDQAAKYNLDTSDGSTDFLRDVIVKLDDLVGDDGQPVPYSDALRDRLFNLPYVRRALARDYFEGISGAREGN